MLVRFEVENFRSLKDSTELSLVAIDRDREGPRRAERLNESLVTTLGLFGPNASGKSNILKALWWLRTAVADSLRSWDEGVPIEPFAFGHSPLEASSFAIEMLVNDVLYEYVLDLRADRVEFEALFHYPEGRRRRIFLRDGDELVLQRGLGYLSGARALLTPQSLALSIMRRFQDDLVYPFIQRLLAISTLGRSIGGSRRFVMGNRFATLRMFDGSQTEPALFELQESVSARERAMSLLKLADLGVSDVVIEETQIDMGDGARPHTLRSPQLVHESSGQTKPFDFKDESEGTRAWFNTIGPVLTALEEGSIVLFDEVDASLHPTLTAQLLKLFRSSGSNPRGAQLIFTSHDASLLNHLNRDEVWLTQKGSDGASRVGSLSEFAGERVRRSQNLESGYLSGRFGALPDVANVEILRELGIVG